MKGMAIVQRYLSGLARKVRRQFDWYFVYSAKERRHARVGNARRWQMKREFQIRFLKQVGLRPHHYLLDFGCGTLRGGVPLIDYLEPGHYYGVEARADVLDEGRVELQDANLDHKRPTLIAAADPSSVSLDQRFDYILAFSVLIHLEDRILDAALGFVRRHLRDDGLFYANVNFGDRPDGNWQGFPVVFRSLAFYEEACSRHGLRVEDMGPLTDFGHVLTETTIEDQSWRRMLRIWKG